MDDGEREKLVILVEAMPNGEDPRVIERAVRRAVSAERGLRADDIALLPPGTPPFTSNGKPRRLECRSRYLDGAFR